MNIITDSLVTISISFTLYFLTSLLGAFLKDFYNTYTQKDEKIRIGRILTGSISATFIMLGFEDYLYKYFGLKTIILISFLMGVLGFEIFKNINSMDGLKGFLIKIKEFRDVYKDIEKK